MEKAMHRQAVDIAPERARPGLALALALLSIPGSTLVWDVVPAGGFLIGLPLAVAAIVLGLRARRLLGGSRMAVAAVAIAGLMIAQMAVWSLVSLVA